MISSCWTFCQAWGLSSVIGNVSCQDFYDMYCNIKLFTHATTVQQSDSDTTAVNHGLNSHVLRDWLQAVWGITGTAVLQCDICMPCKRQCETKAAFTQGTVLLQRGAALPRGAVATWPFTQGTVCERQRHCRQRSEGRFYTGHCFASWRITSKTCAAAP